MIKTMTRLPLPARLIGGVSAGVVFGWAFLQILQLLTAWLPVEPIRQHLLLSVENKSLVPTNYTWGDRARGNEQFTDAAMLTPFISDKRDWRERALGVQMFVRKGSESYDPAPDLIALLKSPIEGDPSNYQARVDRYWYGARLPAGLLLQWMDLGSARRVLVVLEYLSVLALLIAARRHSGEVFILVAWLGACGLLVGPVQFYGATFTFGVPFLYANVFLSCLILYASREKRWPPEIELGGLAFAGALAVYFDLLSGAVWFSFCYALSCIPWLLRVRGIAGWAAVRTVVVALAAFGSGVVFPVLLKQATAVLFLGGNPFSDLVGSANYRLGSGQQITLSAVFVRLVDVSLWLGPGELYWGKVVLFSCVGLMLLAIVCSALRSVLKFKPNPFLMIWTLIGVVFPLGWYVFMRNHTLVHSWFLITWIYIPTGVACASLHFLIRGIQRDSS